MWLETCLSYNLPSVPAKLYLECVEEHKGCPLLVRSDYGTENGIIAGMQCFFCSDNAPFSGELSHRYGSSTRNQRVENWWCYFRKSMASWWINFFKDLVDNGKVNLENEVHKECLWFCFSGILQSALDDMRKCWNTHYIRQSHYETVAGVPDILYFLPENSGGTDCLIPIPQEKIDEIKLECEDAEEENVLQEYFEYLMDTEGIQYPTMYDEAVTLFSYFKTAYIIAFSKYQLYKKCIQQEKLA